MTLTSPDRSHPEDLESIEALMKVSVSGGFPFQREELDRRAALELFADQPYKLELIEGLDEAETISIYRHNGFVDLCQGPHVETTAQIPALKLLSVAGAYWRGDERRPMLQRIYGTAFESESDLEDHLARLEEAERRDHRTLGRQLGLYSMQDEVGPGLVVWHPKGGRVRSIIEDYWKDLHFRRGYGMVYSPHIGRAQLWQTSGHLDFYRESMYTAVEVDEQEYFLKPMNCPFHITIYRSALRSYRELPAAFRRVGHRLPLRTQRRVARTDASARLHSGRRPHLLSPRAGGGGDRRRAGVDLRAAGSLWFL